MLLRKKLSFLLVIVLILTSMTAQLAVNASAPEGWRKLRDIPLIRGTSLAGWAGSGGGELELVNGNVPLDTTETYNGAPTIRINVTRPVPSWWWEVNLTAREDWMGNDFSQYLDNGYLDFYVKGAVGGEAFRVGAQDNSPTRANRNVTVYKNLGDYATITTDWQHVQVPLKDIMDPTKGFDAKRAYLIKLGLSNQNPMKVWISDLKITSPDNEKAYPAIKVNQVGFVTDSEKYALVTGFEDDLQATAGTEFQIKNAADGTVAYTGSLTLVRDFDAVDSGERIFKADFTSFTTPGEYYLSVVAPGIEDSLNFKIGDDVFASTLTDSMRFFFYQRAGMDLTAPYATDYPRTQRTACDVNASFENNQLPPRDVSKGWHDAGDYGRYMPTATNAVSDLFWTYETFPALFTDNQLNIPESGNGVLDILDEIRWELDWILKMQDASTGMFYHRVKYNSEPNATAAIIRGNASENMQSTKMAAATLAHAYLIYKDVDLAFANTCLNAAISAWTFVENQTPDLYTTTGSTDGNTLWAAASLYRTTGDAKFNTFFVNNYANFENRFNNSWASAHSASNMWLPAFLCYQKAENTNSTAIQWFKDMFNIWVNIIVNRSENSGWRNVIMEGNYYWGITSNMLNIPMDAVIGCTLLGTYNQEVMDMAFGNINWVLGANPLRLSYVSGHDEDSHQSCFSHIFSNDGIPGIPKGYLAGGPNRYNSPTLSNFAAKCFLDTEMDWVTNEIQVQWNSALVFMMAFANAGLEKSVQSMAKNANTATDINVLYPWFKVSNDGAAPIKLSDIKLRYYYTADSDAAQNFFCDHAGITYSGGYRVVTPSIMGSFVQLTTPVTGADCYVEIGFSDAAGYLAPGENVEIQSRIAKSDWSNFNQLNDYSFNASSSLYANSNTTTLYVMDNLISGIEP